jgi:hypothetical protein
METLSPRVGVIADAGAGSQELPYEKPGVKSAAATKPAPPQAPDVDIADEEEKRLLDEMA